MHRWTCAALGGMLVFATTGLAREARAQGPADEADKTAKSTAEEAKSAKGEAQEGAEEFSQGMGFLSDHFAKNTATLDVAGLAFGDGVNGQWVHSVAPKFSTVAGANYSRTDAVGGSVTRFGAEAGVDFFLLGQHNEGLRIGPRVVTSLGINTIGGGATFGDIGGGGEVGYNYISRQGLTAGAAAGWDVLFQGSLGNNTSGNADSHPYGKLNVGYSW